MKKLLKKIPLVDVVITDAEYLKDYTISFKFSDGNKQIIDFKKWISTDNGGCKVLLKKSLFKKFEIINDKNISWDNYMDFPFYFLYKDHSKYKFK